MSDDGEFRLRLVTLGTAWAKILGDCQAACDAMQPALSEMARAVQAFWMTLYERVWNCYRAAGMPYGESDEGMLRWLQDRRRIEALRLEAERIELHHATMAEIMRHRMRRAATPPS